MAHTPAVANIGEESASPTVDRLLDTAARMFWEKGYAATTTREIAGALQIQQASLYYHIASQEDLLYQLCLSSVRQFLDDIPSALDGQASPIERIRILIRAHFNSLLKHQRQNATMLTEMRSLSPKHLAEVVDLREKYACLVRSEVADAQKADVIRLDIPAQYLCLALLNMLNWAALWFQEGQALSADALSKVFVEIFLQGAASSPELARSLTPDLTPSKKATRTRRAAKSADDGTNEWLLDAAAALFSTKGYCSHQHSRGCGPARDAEGIALLPHRK